MIVGGMPKAVRTFTNSQSYEKVQLAQRYINDTYLSEIMVYRFDIKRRHVLSRYFIQFQNKCVKEIKNLNILRYQVKHPIEPIGKVLKTI
jgi:hypothetical protein